MFNCVANKTHQEEMLTAKPNPTAAAAATATPTSACKKITQKPVVLSTQRYERILNNAFSNDKGQVQRELEEEQKYREYLKKGSDELIKHFGVNLSNTEAEKLERLKENAEQNAAQTNYDNAKENEEQQRRERIVRAQQLIEKLKPGPRELRTAALQSEVLRARNVQRNINAEFERAIKQNELDEKLKCDKQAMPWIQEEQQRLDERQQRTNKYKQELMQTINENNKQRTDYKKQLIKEQQASRDAVDQEIKAQIEKEKAIMEKKRAALRKNALEAMKMVEQRRMRERMTEEIEDRLCCVYNSGKRHLDTMKVEHVKQQQAERTQIIDTTAKQLANLPNVQALESERIKRDINCMQLKFTAEEAEKKRKDKAAKQARIEAYMRELQQAKEAKRRLEEEKRFEMAQRFKNTEVNCLFEQTAKEERERKVQEMRAQFKQQIEEKTKAENAEKQKVLVDCQQQRYDKEDKFFFEYAKNLMEDAQRKERPLQPFVKVVQQYKRDNRIDCDETAKQPRHLVSHINVGTGAVCKAEAKPAKPLTSDKEQILESCLKITEILAAAKKSENKKCEEQQASMSCYKPGEIGGGDIKNQEQGDMVAAKVPDDCVSMTASAKLRYSMNELKNLNRFAAPPLN